MATPARRLRQRIGLTVLAALALGGRALAAGELDPGFGTGGRVITSFSLSDLDARDMLIKSDGGIVVAGGKAKSD